MTPDPIPTPDDVRRRFKDVFSRLASGVCVVSFWRGGRVHGFTATSVTSVSLDPLRVLFCLSRASDSHACLRPGAAIGISVLHAEQQILSERFARRADPGGYDDVGISKDIPHAPLIEGAIGQIAATVVEIIPSGDHVIVLCDVSAAQASDHGDPLLYCKRTYHRLHHIL
ncbi:flavin reductase family protein [Ancylobacter mangrovi]|uniref:flavin reductase family protein n=1 Tax=Ancylobacter mangrovi TaxID=2972472 RepID=UPI0021614D5F|nr:flavin reductase family protein [Ancylobacter mangrovi]MCS0503252.1 flavin reductase family protein [Ancylobacter mangrovi]